jgi:Bromodomain/Bromodomain extra-terminal - transcription regulation
MFLTNCAALGLLDYPTLIKKPMDFGTIKKKIKNQEYSTLYACGDDVRLIWNNCMTYNADGSDFYKLAQSLYKKWETQWMKFLQEVGNAPAPGEPLTGGHEKVTLQEKKNFAKLLFQISKEDLGKVLLEVERKCPAALQRNASEDEVDFNLDLLDAATLSELTILVQSYVFLCAVFLDCSVPGVLTHVISFLSAGGPKIPAKRRPRAEGTKSKRPPRRIELPSWRMVGVLFLGTKEIEATCLNVVGLHQICSCNHFSCTKLPLVFLQFVLYSVSVVHCIYAPHWVSDSEGPIK